MNNIKNYLLGLILMLPLGAYAEGLVCPVKLDIENIVELRTKGAVTEEVKGVSMVVTATKGLDDVHTKLPISSRKFEDTVTLKMPIKNADGSLTCKYTYEKTFGRTGELELKVEEVK